MDAKELEGWLTATHKSKWYWREVDKQAIALGGDGCTGVPDFRKKYCDEHDVHYRTHKFIFHCYALTFQEANFIFRWRHQRDSWFGRFSPMAWWRYLGVSWGGGIAWRTFGGLKPNGN